MPFQLDASIPTAATDGTKVLFNPQFVDKLDDKELLFLVAHEIMHPVFEHHARRRERDPMLWNIAGDYVINYLLVQERVGTMPKMGLYDQAIYAAGNGMTDVIYENLRQEQEATGQEPDPSGDGSGSALDQVLDASGTPQEVEQATQEMKVRIAQAAQAARAQGRLSAGFKRFVDSILQPKVNWRDVLQRFVERAKTDQRSWSRFNRRFLSQGLYLPSISGESMGELVIAIDCSGSINDRVLAQFAAEVRTIKDDLCPVAIHCVYFDSEVSHHDVVTQDDDLNIQPHGGGGTAFSPVFQFIQDNGIEPVATVFLTDLYCSDFGYAPDYPVLWVSNGDDKAPFGEVVMMEDK
jgi:predicted metal-dependent peptidase